MLWRDLVLFNPHPSSFWLLIPPGTTEEFKRAGGHSVKLHCTLCCTQHNLLLHLLELSLESTPKDFFLCQSDYLFFFHNFSQSLRRCLRLGLRTRPASEEEAAPQSNHLHSWATGRTGEGLWAHTLPWYLHTGGGGATGKTHRGSSSG